jgi:hypothetical protein
MGSLRMKVLILSAGIMLCAGGLRADRYSMTCPTHKVLALATGHIRKQSTECEYSHYVAGTGATHTFWHTCD